MMLQIIQLTYQNIIGYTASFSAHFRFVPQIIVVLKSNLGHIYLQSEQSHRDLRMGSFDLTTTQISQ